MTAILVIDDDDDVRDFISMTLMRAGHDVVLAANGKEGTAAIDARLPETFDLVVCDIFMPGMDGIEFLRGLRQQNPGLRVIAVTGGFTGVAKPYADSMEALGAVASLLKPFSPADLLEAVNQALDA